MRFDQDDWAGLAGFGPDPVETARVAGVGLQVTVDDRTRGGSGLVAAVGRMLAGVAADVQALQTGIVADARRG